MEAIFSSSFLGPYKVSKVRYSLFLYALEPAERTSTSFMGAIREEYLVLYTNVLPNNAPVMSVPAAPP